MKGFEAASRFVLQIGADHQHIDLLCYDGRNQGTRIGAESDDLQLRVALQGIGKEMSVNARTIRDQYSDGNFRRALVDVHGNLWLWILKTSRGARFAKGDGASNSNEFFQSGASPRLYRNVASVCYRVQGFAQAEPRIVCCFCNPRACYPQRFQDIMLLANSNLNKPLR